MRWNLIICLLLVTAVLAKSRSKRSLGYIIDKLFGSNRIVIAQPMLTKNEPYQLFTIPGYNDIIIKVSRNKTQSHKNDAVIVKPEVAIIGSYLGTVTEKETLLAMEMVKNLIKSGVLAERRGSLIEELVVPIIPQPPRLKYYEDQNVPINVYEEGHMYVPMRMQPVGIKPVHTKYSYKQKTPDADTTYESYDGHDVIVTRTGKEPPIPKYIKLRIAEVVTIAANPYAVKESIGMNGNPIPYYVNPGPMMPEYVQDNYFAHRMPQPHRNVVPKYVGNGNSFDTGAIRPSISLNSGHIPYNVNAGPKPQRIQNPASYLTHRPLQPVINGVADIGDNGYRGPVMFDRNPAFIPEPIAIGNPYNVANNMQLSRCNEKSTARVCPHGNIQLKARNNRNIVPITNNPKQTTVGNNGNDNDGQSNNAYSIAVNEFLKNHSVNGQLVSQYLYRQMNNHSHANYTVVKVGKAPEIEKIYKNNDDVYKDYLYIPPKDVNSPMLNVFSPNDKSSNGNVADQDDKNALISKISIDVNSKPYVPSLITNGLSNKGGFDQYPIVVSEQLYNVNGGQGKRDDAVKNDDFYDENYKRGDIPGATF